MSRPDGLQLTPATLRRNSPFGPAVPVLIEVPALRATRPRAGHTRFRVAARTRRRRLRREVRVAGYALLSALPFLFASTVLVGGRPRTVFGSVPAPTASVRVGTDLASALSPPVISITIEPAERPVPVEPEPPVVLPGYLLPDDGSEEAPHAGS